ncbi:MAG: 6-carboxytetrahydropterin synthase [Verrucomicrobia bacterium]|nr:6-carboxytetrahydropterin synthase [Verrucomicrobiota bacterium]
MPKARLTKRVSFSAGHRLFNPALSEDENARLYGKCANPGGHGHNYVLEVTVEGEIDPRTGMVLNFARLSETIRTEVLDRFDHRNLNTEVEPMRGLVPTAEHVAVAIWRLLERRMVPARLVEVRVAETDTNIATYRGEGEL